MSSTKDEPLAHVHRGKIEHRLLEILERAESFLLLFVALVLIALAAVTLVNTVLTFSSMMLSHETNNFLPLVNNGIDELFQVIILAELLHTTLSRGSVSTQLQEFLVVGITVVVRHGLELASQGGVTGKGVKPIDPTQLVIDLVINAAAALILIGGLWLVQQFVRSDRRADSDIAARRASAGKAPASDTPAAAPDAGSHTRAAH